MKHWIKRIMGTEIPQSRLNISLLVFRVIVSLSLINTHGFKKIRHFDEALAHTPDPLGLGAELNLYFAIFSNLVCPVFVILGLFTRVAILPIVAVTLMGFLVVHAADPWAVKDVPFMYSMVFLLLLVLGPGQYSFDHQFSRK